MKKRKDWIGTAAVWLVVAMLVFGSMTLALLRNRWEGDTEAKFVCREMRTVEQADQRTAGAAGAALAAAEDGGAGAL